MNEPLNEESDHAPDLRDEFPDTPARRAVVSVVRGFGALARRRLLPN